MAFPLGVFPQQHNFDYEMYCVFFRILHLSIYGLQLVNLIFFWRYVQYLFYNLILYQKAPADFFFQEGLRYWISVTMMCYQHVFKWPQVSLTI